jgi:UDP-glucuronate 4-epimerase
MRLLVTGAAGFIGYHVAKRLLDRGDEVVGIDNLNSYYDPALKHARLAQLEGRDGFTFIQMDIANRPEMARLFAAEKPDRVVHLAAQAGVRHSLDHPHDYVDSNIVGFVNVLEGCRHAGVQHLVYASSSSVYGANERVPFSVADNVDHPISLYAASKKANELMAHSYSHLFALPTTGLRFFTVYGPWGRPDMAYFKFTQRHPGRAPDRDIQQRAAYARLHLYRRHRRRRGAHAGPGRHASLRCLGRQGARTPRVPPRPTGSTISATTGR